MKKVVLVMLLCLTFLVPLTVTALSQSADNSLNRTTIIMSQEECSLLSVVSESETVYAVYNCTAAVIYSNNDNLLWQTIQLNDSMVPTRLTSNRAWLRRSLIISGYS